MIRPGWIKTHRKIVDHPRFKTNGWINVWFWILCEAAWEPKKALWKGQVIILSPGQLTAGRKQISEATGIHQSSVFRLLSAMVEDGQIEQQTSNVCSLITITNWDSYQMPEQPANNQRTTDEQPANTSEEEKNLRSKEPPMDLFRGNGEAGEESPKPKWAPDETMVRVASWFKRLPGTRWSAKELKAWNSIPDTLESEIAILEGYYKANLNGNDYRRRDLQTLLNNWQSEIDRAKNFKHHASNQGHRSQGPDRNAGTANENSTNNYNTYKGLVR